MTTHHDAPDHGQSRRSFLAKTAALASAGAFFTGCAAGAKGGSSGSSSSSGSSGSSGGWQATIAKAKPRAALKDGDTVKMGVIGLGGPGGCAMGLGHCLDFARINNKGEEKVHVAAICDLNQMFLEHGSKQLAGEQKSLTFDTYTDYRKLLAREDLHGVLLAVPEHWHADLAIEAISAGKDVYLEKPMTLRLSDAMRLLEAQKLNPDVRVQVGTQQVNFPKFHEARKLIRDGTIGQVTLCQTSYCRNSKDGEWHYTINKDWKPGVNLDWDTWCKPLGPMAWDPKVYYQWRRYRKTSTGVIGDLLVHVMTPMMMAIEQGWPVKVAANGSHLVDKAMENHDNLQITCEFESGAQMIVAGSTCNEVGLETLIRGHKGNIYLGGRNCELRPERPFSEEVEGKKIDCPDIGDDQHRHRLKWLKCIRTREQPDSTVELGTKVMVVVDLATRSMWEGGAFGFDPKTMKVTRL